MTELNVKIIPKSTKNHQNDFSKRFAWSDLKKKNKAVLKYLTYNHMSNKIK